MKRRIQKNLAINAIYLIISKCTVYYLRTPFKKKQHHIILPIRHVIRIFAIKHDRVKDLPSSNLFCVSDGIRFHRLDFEICYAFFDEDWHYYCDFSEESPPY